MKQLIPRRRITIVHDSILVAATIDLDHWNGSACWDILNCHHPGRNRRSLQREIGGTFAYEEEPTDVGKGS